MPVLRQVPCKARGGHMIFKGINRTLRSDRDRAWLAGTARCARLVGLESSLIFSSLREAQPRTSGVTVSPSC